MNIVQINATTNIGSTGKIMFELDDVIRNYGHNGFMVSAYTNDYTIKNQYCTNSGNYELLQKKNIFISRLTGKTGYRYKKETKKAMEWIDTKKPDILHLHNIHGDWLNIEVLFNYIRENKIPVVWTLHDCWAFTGRCSHFEMCGCKKWKTGCYECQNKRTYPITYFFDFSQKMWREKKKLFSDLHINIVTPSKWLENYVKESFLGKYPISVINNGINTDIYKRCAKKSKYLDGCENKKIVLGVASSWSARKGFDDFLTLASRLRGDEYQVVMVGLNNNQLSRLPSNIIGIARTNNQQELVELYSSADVFVNPTYQDNYPTTNLEAVSCGTLSVTYNTGGSPESIVDPQYVINQGDVVALQKIIEKVCDQPIYTESFLRKYAEQNFDKYKCYDKYIDLYNRIV